MTEEEEARLELAYGSSYQRLVELKNRYDPSNLFRLNQNIPPTGVSARRSRGPAALPQSA